MVLILKDEITKNKWIDWPLSMLFPSFEYQDWTKDVRGYLKELYPEYKFFFETCQETDYEKRIELIESVKKIYRYTKLQVSLPMKLQQGKQKIS